MGDSIQDCETPPDGLERTNAQLTEFVNLEAKKQKLFKIACNNEPDQKNNNNELGEELKDMTKEDIVKLCQSKDEWENTALHYAAKAGNLDICKILVSSGADLNATGQNRMKVLPFAARYGDEKRAAEVWECMSWIAKEMKKSVPTIIVSDLAPKRSLSHRQSIKLVKLVKKKDEVDLFEVHERDEYKFSILHHAIQNTNWVTNPVVVQKLIATENFRITETDNQGNTCLHLAAQLDKQTDDKIFDVFFNNSSISQDDISRCIEAKNNLGMTPLHIACNVGNQDSLNELLEACGNNGITVDEIFNAPDKNGLLPLCHATNCRNLDMVNTLLNEDAQVTKGTMITAARLVSIHGLLT